MTTGVAVQMEEVAACDASAASELLVEQIRQGVAEAEAGRDAGSGRLHAVRSGRPEVDPFATAHAAIRRNG